MTTLMIVIATTLSLFAILVIILLFWRSPLVENSSFDENSSFVENSMKRLKNKKEIVMGSYKIVEYPTFLSREECRVLIDAAIDSGAMKAAETLDSKKTTLSSYDPSKRTSKTVFLEDSRHELIREISKISSILTSIRGTSA